MNEREIVEGVALAVDRAAAYFRETLQRQLDEVPLEKRAAAAMALRDGRYEVRVSALPDGVTLQVGVAVEHADAHFPVAMAVGLELLGCAAWGLTPESLGRALGGCPDGSVVLPAADGTLRVYEPGGAVLVGRVEMTERGYEWRAGGDG
jgi:hypothetical protein